MCLAQGHNAVTPVRLEPASPRSRVKHSTTEPLRSICSPVRGDKARGLFHVQVDKSWYIPWGGGCLEGNFGTGVLASF